MEENKKILEAVLLSLSKVVQSYALYLKKNKDTLHLDPSAMKDFYDLMLVAFIGYSDIAKEEDIHNDKIFEALSYSAMIFEQLKDRKERRYGLYAEGERSVAFGNNISNSTVITGDNNNSVVQSSSTQMTQHNFGNAKGYQQVVNGGTVYIGGDMKMSDVTQTQQVIQHGKTNLNVANMSFGHIGDTFTNANQSANIENEIGKLGNTADFLTEFTDFDDFDDVW